MCIYLWKEKNLIENQNQSLWGKISSVLIVLLLYCLALLYIDFFDKHHYFEHFFSEQRKKAWSCIISRVLWLYILYIWDSSHAILCRFGRWYLTTMLSVNPCFLCPSKMYCQCLCCTFRDNSKREVKGSGSLLLLSLLERIKRRLWHGYYS